MHIAGIICEYNPLHSGHVYHLNETRRRSGADLVVCVMSGEFTQRGEPAICDKWTRARMAVHAGADVVLELPFIYAVRSAEHFAAGAVRLLASIGAQTLSFGAETTDMPRLLNAAALLNDESAAFRDCLRTELDLGRPYAAARRTAAEQVHGAWLAELLAQPNTMLAVEYLRAIARFDGRLEPLAIPRLGSSHDGTWIPGTYPSAAAVRTALLEAPEERSSICHAAGVPCEFALTLWKEPLFTLLSGRLRLAAATDLELLPDMEPGLSWRLIEAGRTARCYKALVDVVTTRRYPPARIMRILLYALFGVTKAMAKRADDGEFPLYGRVLAVREESMHLFGALCRKAAIPVATSPKALPDGPPARLDQEASDMYGLLLRPVRPAGADFTTSFPVVAAPAR